MHLLFPVLAIVGLVTPVIGQILERRGSAVPKLLLAKHWAALGVGSLVGSLILHGWTLGQMPMRTVPGGLQAVALLVGAAWLVLRRKERMDVAGLILSSLAALLTIASLIEAPVDGSDIQSSPFFALHITLIFLGIGCFAVSFVLSALFLVQRRRLKTKRFQGIRELPSMDVLDRLNFRTQGFGFVALTAGVAMGVALAVDRASSVSLTDLTVWGTGTIWLWYAIGLHARLVGGWRGRTAAVFGTIGFGAVSFVLGVAVLLVGSWHGA